MWFLAKFLSTCQMMTLVVWNFVYPMVTTCILQKNEPKEDPHISSKSEKVKGEKEEKRKRTMGDIKL